MRCLINQVIAQIEGRHGTALKEVEIISLGDSRKLVEERDALATKIHNKDQKSWPISLYKHRFSDIHKCTLLIRPTSIG